MTGAPPEGNVPDCIPCCPNCRSRTSQQHLAAQPGMGATLGTPRTGNMVLSLAQALITSQSLAAAPAASPGLVHHTQTSAEPPGSCTSIFLSCWGCFDLPPSFSSLLFTLPLSSIPGMLPGGEDPYRSPVFVGCPCLLHFVSRAQGDLAEIGAEASSGIRLRKMALCFLSPPN